MNGVLNIYKPQGITSFDVIKIIRKLTGEKKVGHAGTLDPMASGVLPVCIGKSTKIIDFIMENNKVYVTKLKLGIVTDTYDTEGKILEENSLQSISKEKIIKVVNSFLGESEQIPPMYSALKVNGKRLYELARQGIEIERSKRKIFINNISILDIDIPYVKFQVECSKGTYIRSLCYDIGKLLNCGATMWNLERIQTGPFTKENSLELSNLNLEKIKENLIPMDLALNKYDKLSINEKMATLLRNGVIIKNKYFINNIPYNKIFRLYYNDSFIGIGNRTDEGLKLVKLLS